jgi:uncharacterized protein (DUF488 family)
MRVIYNTEDLMPATLWTIGHSTRSIEDFVSALKGYEIEALVDVRTVPRSRWNPQFNKEEMERALPKAGIDYLHAKGLGGLRKTQKDSPNTGWRNASFRGFADYMQTPEFDEALAKLIELAESKRTVLMCAEIVPWRCHRSLIADALMVRGFDIVEIFEGEKSQPHTMTPFAVVNEGRVTYPPKRDGGDAEGQLESGGTEPGLES